MTASVSERKGWTPSGRRDYRQTQSGGVTRREPRCSFTMRGGLSLTATQSLRTGFAPGEWSV